MQICYHWFLGVIAEKSWIADAYADLWICPIIATLQGQIQLEFNKVELRHFLPEALIQELGLATFSEICVMWSMSKTVRKNCAESVLQSFHGDIILSGQNHSEDFVEGQILMDRIVRSATKGSVWDLSIQNQNGSVDRSKLMWVIELHRRKLHQSHWGFQAAILSFFDR
jgi:hypothetical protein